MKQQPLYSSLARQDLVEILEYISRDKPGAALTWVEKIEAKCLLIARNHKMGELRPELGDNVRATLVGRYVIFHRSGNDGVQILRVLPGERNVCSLT